MEPAEYLPPIEGPPRRPLCRLHRETSEANSIHVLRFVRGLGLA